MFHYQTLNDEPFLNDLLKIPIAANIFENHKKFFLV